MRFLSQSPEHVVAAVAGRERGGTGERDSTRYRTGARMPEHDPILGGRLRVRPVVRDAEIRRSVAVRPRRSLVARPPELRPARHPYEPLPPLPVPGRPPRASAGGRATARSGTDCAGRSPRSSSVGIRVAVPERVSRAILSRSGRRAAPCPRACRWGGCAKHVGSTPFSQPPPTARTRRTRVPSGREHDLPSVEIDLRRGGSRRCVECRSRKASRRHR